MLCPTRNNDKSVISKVVVNILLAIIEYEFLVSNPTKLFQCTFRISCAYFLFAFNDGVKTTTDSIKGAFIVTLLLPEVIVQYFKIFGP